jgi:DNA (cytosine-5)-methyltransferase 1
VSKLKSIDLFSGVGGFSLACENNNVECIFANDFESKCKIIYDQNFKIKQTTRDIREIIEFQNFDILTAGFPCQSFSIAGKRLGFTDINRGNLFFEIIRILKNKKPQAFILENDKNLISHDNGKTFKIIQEELDKSGYSYKYKIMDTSEYGNIPQHRERIYIVGFKDEIKTNKFNFPEKITLDKKVNDILEDKIEEKYYYNKESKIYSKLLNTIVDKNKIYQYRRHFVRENKKNLCPTLTANMGMGGHNVPIILDDKGIRKLTPRECFNLQGFPETFKLSGISDSSLYKQSGNSVSIPVVDRIVKELVRVL